MALRSSGGNGSEKHISPRTVTTILPRGGPSLLRTSRCAFMNYRVTPIRPARVTFSRVTTPSAEDFNLAAAAGSESMRKALDQIAATIEDAEERDIWCASPS